MGISAFPQGSLERERPPGGGGNAAHKRPHIPPPLRGTPGALKGGVAPSIFSPLVRRAVCRTSGLSRLEETRIGRVRFLSRCSSDAGFRTKT